MHKSKCICTCQSTSRNLRRIIVEETESALRRAVFTDFFYRAVKSFWKKTIFEYFNVDASSDMNDLSLILLKGGTGQGKPNLKGVFYRQFLPANKVIASNSLNKIKKFN